MELGLASPPGDGPCFGHRHACLMHPQCC
ncbi:unnamed protein product, partial [Allacma fusca]